MLNVTWTPPEHKIDLSEYNILVVFSFCKYSSASQIYLAPKIFFQGPRPVAQKVKAKSKPGTSRPQRRVYFSSRAKRRTPDDPSRAHAQRANVASDGSAHLSLRSGGSSLSGPHASGRRTRRVHLPAAPRLLPLPFLTSPLAPMTFSQRRVPHLSSLLSLRLNSHGLAHSAVSSF
jgi:hypothetical protein